MAVTLTHQQRAAVDNRGGELLVSAAAGSGKTRILVERLLNRVEQEHLDLDRFLVITYTLSLIHIFHLAPCAVCYAVPGVTGGFPSAPTGMGSIGTICLGRPRKAIRPPAGAALPPFAARFVRCCGGVLLFLVGFACYCVEV